MSRFGRILIANRGEIAVRIARTARALGLETVAVFSEADRHSAHVEAADRAVCIGPAPAAASYLNIANILAAARASGADAVHPGYGFLSENAEFARACLAAGLVFIGPSPEAIEVMGNKDQALARAREVGLPCLPGYQGQDQRDETLLAAGQTLGFPLMVKASSGGGGRGMRLVSTADQLPQALCSARSEAHAAFGNGSLFLEKALTRARHIEIQIIADQQGNTLYLGERDCSVQRRHQKIIEEAPSPFVDERLRRTMGRAAVQLARSVGYCGAGTVEFLVEENRDFFFLEMNTRLQVEHGVTELVTGLDLVALQLEIAAGNPLPLKQKDIKIRGHAMEARLYTESPSAGFLPRSGRVHYWLEPQGAGIRVDHGLRTGDCITSFYDPMVARVLAHGPDREVSRTRLVQALNHCVLLGVEHNRAFLQKILEHPSFINAQATTGWIDQQPVDHQGPDPAADLALAAALLTHISASAHPLAGQWHSRPPAIPFILELLDQAHLLTLEQTRAGHYSIQPGNYQIQILERAANRLRYSLDQVQHQAFYAISGTELFLKTTGDRHIRDKTLAAPERAVVAGQGQLTAVMDGRIIALPLAVGDPVLPGQTLAIMEAMKMEHHILADLGGRVARIHVTTGQQVKARTLLVEVDPTAL